MIEKLKTFLIALGFLCFIASVVVITMILVSWIIGVIINFFGIMGLIIAGIFISCSALALAFTLSDQRSTFNE